MLNQMDEDDFVVEEIPVFLSRNLQDNLYLFQYPTKTHTFNFDSAEVTNCCIKPVNNEVKVDFTLSTENKCYDRFKGEQFAIAADGKTQQKGERPTFKRGIMDKLSFVSTKSIEDPNKYILGIYQDREIHLSPLTSILQLRPNFQHFDKEDKRTKAEEKAINEEDDDEELQQVTVKFSRASTGAKKAKDKTYDSFLKKSVEEPWCETYWHPRSSPTAELERQKLFATNHQTSLSLAMDAKKYVEKLLPNECQEKEQHNVLSSNVISKHSLKILPLVDQLKVILTDGKMLTFDSIMEILFEIGDTSSLTTEKVLRTLPIVGTLIHGNWVPQSEILYPAESLSNANGVSSELMIRARDYIIFRFSKNEFLYRRQVIVSTQLPPEEALEVLQSVARLNSEKKWELILSPDKAFELRFPDLVQRQERLWQATEQHYNEMDSEKLTKRIRKRSAREAKHEKIS